MNQWVLSRLILSQQTNMDCVDSYWFNSIKCNEYCQNDSIEVVRSRFIRNMWFVDIHSKYVICGFIGVKSQTAYWIYNQTMDSKKGHYRNTHIQTTTQMVLTICLIIVLWLSNADSILTCSNGI